MKKITVIFGGSVGLYHGYFRIFDLMENEFKCKLRRNAPAKFTTKINNIIIEFTFCYNPRRDKNYYASRKIIQEKFKDIAPKPAEEFVKTIKNTNMVLFFGLCGAFNGNKGTIYCPKEFREVFFEDKIIKHKEIFLVEPKNPVKIKNILLNHIKSKPTRIVTSNVTLTHGNIENESKEHLIILANNLSKSGDAVDKESYQVAKHFNGKLPIGVMLMSSDVLSIKKHMLTYNNFKPDVKKFNKACFNSLDFAINRLKNISK
jgi:hypothetical protein